MDYRSILQKVIYTIEYSLEDDISLARLSEQANISMYHFSRLFEIYTGLSPIEYVRRRRMLHAAVAIYSGEKILPVAVRYGYSGHSAFSKAFKKVSGYPPSLCRKVGNSRIQSCVNLYTQETGKEGKVTKSFETERLEIRHFRSDDWKQVQTLAVNKESSEGGKYDTAWPTSDDGCRKMAEFLSGTDFFRAVCLKEDGKIIGLIAFNSIDENRALDLGHLFHTDYMTGEVMTEALRRMVQYAFDELEIDRIVTHNAAEWKGQTEPLRKIGMREIGEIPDSPTFSDGKPAEFITCVLGISRQEWEKGNR